jgi:tryptophan-rich sensory protein
MGKTGYTEIIKFLASILLCQAAGIIGSIFTAPAIPVWYEFLNKPSFQPPNSLFAPVWIALYLLMGIALFMVWHHGLSTRGVKPALIVFFFQLVLNALWSILFFGLRSPQLAFYEIVVLLVAIVLTVYLFSRVTTAGAVLMIPYLAWVSFAAVLNYSIWQLNK